MGSCFSTYSETSSQLTSKVITLNGELQEYSVDTTVSEVLNSETAQSCFLCNSDRLYYNEFIQALKPNEQLQMGQIYFVLPATQLKNRLTAPDMAALAVKAGSAISKTSKRGSWKSKNLRISPVLEISQKYNEERFDTMQTLSRSGTVRKLQRAQLAIRSFRLRLGTVYEGSVA